LKNTAIHSRELQHRVDIYQIRKLTQNAFGGLEYDLAKRQTVWAKIEYKDVNQRYDQAGMTNFDEQMVFTLRYDSNLSNFPERYFLVWNKFKYVIQKASCQDINKVYITLNCLQESTTEFEVPIAGKIITEINDFDIVTENDEFIIIE